MRVLLGAFGDPGHAFPMIALGRALAARGHDVTLQTWARWREPIEAEGLRFATAPEYHVFPNGGVGSAPLDFYEAVVYATRDTVPLVRELRPDVVVADILTLAPALSAELEGVPWATLIPHVNPHPPSGAPIYSIGARLPSTALGRAFWLRAGRPVEHGLERGRRDLNGVRARLGLPPLDHVHGGTSRELALVATFPQLEYPRGHWPAHVHVVGPLMWEPPTADVRLPPGEDPLVLVAPSTSKDPEHRLLGRRSARPRRRPGAGVGDLEPPSPAPPAAGARQRAPGRLGLLRAHHAPLRRSRLPRRPRHLVRALSTGCAVVACPVAGDMSENAARLDWAGAGVRVPRRFVSPRPLRLAVERALGDPSIRARARELAAWSQAHDPGDTAAALVEGLATRSHSRAAGCVST